MPVHPQDKGDWAWMSGSSSPSNYDGEPGIYGTLGTFAAGNTPASRYLASRWTDSSGNLWLFGGYGIDADGSESGLNDLWEFNPSTNEWAWVGGSIESGATSGLPGVYGTLGTFAAGNIPGTRYGAVSWIDKSGNFWLFGGLGYDGVGGSGWLNDLWEFNPSTKEWAWISGSDSAGGSGQVGVFGTQGTFAAGNVPGGRQGATGWIDKSGNLWLFGGTGFASSTQLGYLNDLWEFNPSTKEWAWMSGSSTMSCPGINGANCGASAVYGTLGKPAVGNVPGALTGPVSWIDGSGNLWLFGGALDQSISNDMWEFSPSTKEWTWMGGSSLDNQPGVYGTLGTAAAGNIPGSRMQAVSLTDSSGNFWLFGGTGYSSTDAYGDLDDLWKFNPSTNEWTWIDGSSAANPAAVYGTFGTPAADNIPGGRQGASGWFDASGNLWIFGGYGSPNDLWKYQLSAATLPAAATPTFSVASGTYTAVQSVKISDTTAGANLYYSTNAASETPVWNAYSGPIAVDTTEAIEATAMASGHSTSAAATATYTINLPPAATPTFSLPSGTFTTTQTVTISDATAGATIYYTTNGTAPTTASPVYTGAIEITSSVTIEAIALAPGYSISAVASATYNLEAIPTFISLTSSSNPSNVSQYVTFTAMVTAPLLFEVPPGSVQFSVNGVAMGSPVPLKGIYAVYTTAALFAGSDSITATYIPTIGSGYTASTGTLVQSVAGNCAGITATTLSSSQNPSTLGQPVTLTATVVATAIPACVIGTPATGTATYAPSGIYGTVQFTVNGVAAGAPVIVSSGTANVFAGVTATYTTSALAAGTNVIGAVFTEGNGYFESSTAAGLSQVVNGSGFVLTLTPSSLTIAQGSSGTSSITVTGAASPVTLAALGLPSGVTATFSPNPTSGTSVLTLAVSAFAATGNSTITITGTSGGRTASTTIALAITAAPFALSISPTYLSVPQCGSGLVTLTQADLAAGVNYTFTGLPSGVTATIDPVPTRVGVTIYTIAASCSAVPQLVTVTVTGTYGGQTETATFALDVSYAVSASPASLTIPQSGKGASTIAVAGVPAGKFPSGVTFEASNLPNGVTASFSPTSSINTSLLTLTASSTAPAGAYTVTISAIGNISNTLEVLLGSTTIAVTVTAPPPSTCTIDYVIQPQNTSAFGANITINNTGTTALTSWTLSWAFANGQTITQLWNGAGTQSGASVTVTNESYNGSIAAGASYSGVGFNGTWNGVTNAVPTAISLNGMACVVN